MAIYEAINCPFQIGDVVRGRPLIDIHHPHHPDVPQTLMRVTGIRPKSPSGDFKMLPYCVRLVDFRTGEKLLPDTRGWAWVGYLELDPFMTAVARANA